MPVTTMPKTGPPYDLWMDLPEPEEYPIEETEMVDFQEEETTVVVEISLGEMEDLYTYHHATGQVDRQALLVLQAHQDHLDHQLPDDHCLTNPPPSRRRLSGT
jgi:hypothetical protein